MATTTATTEQEDQSRAHVEEPGQQLGSRSATRRWENGALNPNDKAARRPTTVPTRVVRDDACIKPTVPRGRHHRTLTPYAHFPLGPRVARASPAQSADGDYFGRTVNTAARIAAYARSGEVLVSDAVLHAADLVGCVRRPDQFPWPPTPAAIRLVCTSSSARVTVR